MSRKFLLFVQYANDYVKSAKKSYQQAKKASFVVDKTAKMG